MERKGQERKLRTDNGKKKSKFWLMRMLRIETMHNFVIFGDSIVLVKNRFFLAKGLRCKSIGIRGTKFEIHRKHIAM